MIQIETGGHLLRVGGAETLEGPLCSSFTPPPPPTSQLPTICKKMGIRKMPPEKMMLWLGGKPLSQRQRLRRFVGAEVVRNGGGVTETSGS